MRKNAEVYHGIILKTALYQDSSQYLSLLSQEVGKIWLSAPNAKRSTKRFHGGIDLFDYGEFTVVTSPNGIKRLQDFTSEGVFANLRSNLERNVFATICSESSEYLLAEESLNTNLFKELKQALTSLNNINTSTKNAARTTFSYLTRLLLENGATDISPEWLSEPSWQKLNHLINLVEEIAERKLNSRSGLPGIKRNLMATAPGTT
jgi:DNA repair protein RecO